MRKFLILAIFLAALIFPAASLADKGGVPHHKASAPDPTFACDGITCTFTVIGLVANTNYQASVSFTAPPTVQGCHLGISAQTSDDTGALTFTMGEANVKCSRATGYTGPGTVTAWVRAGTSLVFSDPPVTLSDGSLAETTASIT